MLAGWQCAILYELAARKRLFETTVSMNITVQLPDEIASHLGDIASMPRQMLEAFAAEAYRANKVSRHQLSRLLALDYWQTEDFLTCHQAKRPYTIADIQTDRQSLAALPRK